MSEARFLSTTTVPILYNLKHSIELIFKSLKIEIDAEFIRSHETTDLINALQASIKRAKLSIPKPEQLNELMEIAERYYTLEFWNKRFIRTASILDSDNDIFRFPDTRPNFILDLECFRSVSKKEVRGLHGDIMRLEQLFGILRYGISSEKSSIEI
jgi:hypothetical protein